ncbi:hypothetical protein QQZ08_010670 [Neonectria magnoliae]|uniref:Heparan-alpha-glucosaminide N-acetyltransferase catalytic domain-containing protein n=1 Tax=Neonectria magnoliae TaxID=2732573 RepID=A0ABR1HGZ9_9HYPO
MARPADDDAASTRPGSPRRPGGYGSFSPRQPKAAPPPPPPTTTRALAPDLLRGFLMLAMALDHTALALNAWEHGTGRTTEADGAVVGRWNRPAAYAVRTLTHLCAPGFTLLLGVGVAYLGRARTRLGWAPGRIARHFAVRGAALTLVNTVLGLLVTGGRVWFVNFVLFALAVDYFLAGALWLAVARTEPWLARAVAGLLPEDVAEDADEPLLPPEREGERPTRAAAASWHIHNALLFVFAVVTIWWNIWLSPSGGHCQPQSSASMTLHEFSAAAAATAADGPRLPSTPAVSESPFLGIWFWVVQTDHVMSAFPPLAWLSFAVLGLLYARVDLARPWSRRAILLGHCLAGLLFSLLFVLTRALRFGNLSEDCLHTPDHDAHPQRNPYLASVQAFLYVVKYPPDVAFWAFTLAGNFFLLALFGGLPVRIGKRLTLLLDFGRAALFFYVVHLFMVFIVGAILVPLLGHDVGIPNPQDPDKSMGIDNVWAYLAIWGTCMLLLWPVTRWYSRFKSTKPVDSIWRFF